MLTKLLRAISGSPERTDWESMLTQVSGDGSVWGDSDAVRTGGFPANRLVAAPDPNAPDVNLALLGLSGEEITHAGEQSQKNCMHWPSAALRYNSGIC